MPVKEFELFHGAVLTKLLRSESPVSDSPDSHRLPERLKRRNFRSGWSGNTKKSTPTSGFERQYEPTIEGAHNNNYRGASRRLRRSSIFRWMKAGP